MVNLPGITECVMPVNDERCSGADHSGQNSPQAAHRRRSIYHGLDRIPCLADACGRRAWRTYSWQPHRVVHDTAKLQEADGPCFP